MGFWITALHVACKVIEQGNICTGYGTLRKVLHMCKHAYSKIVQYHAKIDELFERKKVVREKETVDRKLHEL